MNRARKEKTTHISMGTSTCDSYFQGNIHDASDQLQCIVKYENMMALYLFLFLAFSCSCFLAFLFSRFLLLDLVEQYAGIL